MLARAHPAISHCSHLLLKCKVATNMCHWLKVQSRWFKSNIFAKKCILISFWIFKYCFYLYYYFTLYYCAIFYSLDAGFFQYHLIVKHFVGLTWVQTVCKGYRQTTKVAPSGLNKKQLVDTTFWLKLISFGSNFFHLTKC